MFNALTGTPLAPSFPCFDSYALVYRPLSLLEPIFCLIRLGLEIIRRIHFKNAVVDSGNVQTFA